MTIKKDGERKWKRMAKKLNSECWYSEVCRMDNPCDSCIRYTEMKFLMDNSGLPKIRQKPISLIPDDVDYDQFVRLSEIKDEIAEFVESGKNLFICGYTGNGKTSWAIKILLKYFDQIWAGNGFRVRGMFVHVPTLLLNLKNFDNPLPNSYKESLNSADLIVWDEIGTNISDYDYSQLLMYVDSRLLNGKSNIFTSNIVTYESLSRAIGNRLASRIDGSDEKIILKGGDRR